MKVNREALLDNTHYGLSIYSHVLRQYYPDETVLSHSGRDCKPTNNPFNMNRPTLKVSVNDYCAEHIDLEHAIEPGNCFDFASKYYGVTGQDLYNKLNEDMHLYIDQQRDYSLEDKKKDVKVEIEDFQPHLTTFSFFRMPISNITPYYNVNVKEVYKFIKGPGYVKDTETLRKFSDVKDARKYKASHFDYVTFSGEFSKWNEKNLLRHSGLLTIDFDHVFSIDDLKEKLLKDKYFETELLFTSPSGDGLKWIIPIDITKATHLNHFKSTANYIKVTYQLDIDQSGKDISRACFLPYDPDVYINPKYLKS